MSKPKLTYFDIPTSRGEECRLALHVAGVTFEDNRVPFGEWPAMKPNTPFGSLPTLELPGERPLAQSNAILAYVGRTNGMHPQDAFEAARHEAVMASVEDLRAHVGPLLRVSDPAEKLKTRETLAETYLPAWAAYIEKQIGAGPFFAGDTLNVVDIKLHMAVRWFASGNVDHIPTTVFANFPKLTRIYESVRDDARIKAWYAK